MKYLIILAVLLGAGSSVYGAESACASGVCGLQKKPVRTVVKAVVQPAVKVLKKRPARRLLSRVRGRCASGVCRR